MPHRIFIAINLPDEVKNELISFQKKLPELPARWAKPENLHITLVFIGSTPNKELQNLQNKTQEVVRKHKPFTLKLSHISYGPSASQPRMIWAVGETTKELLALQEELAQSFNRVENRDFSLHITLARFNLWEFQRMEPEERPEIDEEIDIEIPVNSIEIMESKLKRKGAEYAIVQLFVLG